MNADRLGIEYLSAPGVSPVALVHLAADLGCRHISIGPDGLEDPGARRALLDALDDRGVSLSLGEGCVIVPEADVRRHRELLDTFAELGVPRVNTVSFDGDAARSIEQFAALAALVAERGMVTVMETSRGFVPGDLPSTVDVIAAVGRDDFRFLVDTMHVSRSRTSPADLAAIDRSLIGYVQLCDVPLRSTRQWSYLDEAMYHRLAPGDGELPLAELLAAVPDDVVIGLEVPNADVVGDDALRSHLERCVAAARRLLAD